MTHPEAQAFNGTTRFALLRRLGEGGFGVVYEAHDSERNVSLALKALRGVHGDSIYRFKQEFRTLADLIHPNLVLLHELLNEGGHWFFTMELVDGLDWVDYVRHARRGAPGYGAAADTLEVDKLEAPTAPAIEAAWASRDQAAGPVIPLPNGQEVVLRGVLRQTAEGLMALHAAGKLHCDIKPPNVLVSRQGRVVILDFGLATELAGGSGPRARPIAGTPHYMSPEQAAGLPAGEPSDWYSLGVMLYEALTGRLPFVGSPQDVVAQKVKGEAPAPGILAPGIPPDLDALCQDLLRRDPVARPNGMDILARMGATSPAPRRRRLAPGRGTPFVGRRGQLATLGAAFLSLQDGVGATVLVHGGSGMGKTALMRRFLEEIGDQGDVLVLSGRCYEQESVPYKALDSLMDALSQHLTHLAPAAAQEVLPRDVAALGRLFPVLHRVGAIERTQDAAHEIRDPQELRRRARAALRELLFQVATRRPLVLVVDDLQWGDAESAVLLAKLVQPPHAPPLLLIACYRTEEADTSPLLRVLLPALSGAVTIDLPVGQLGPEEARDLASSLLREGSLAPGRAEAIAQEARGNPFFINELARHASGARRPGEPDPLARSETTLEDVIRARVVRLPGSAQRLLELAAVAGQPVSRVVLNHAAEVDAEGYSAMALLQASHLLRTRETGQLDEIETYHDRIRETVVAGLSKETLAAHHLRLARALEASDHADPETLAVHLEAAGHASRAAQYAALAGDKAAQALAFDRAARLYRRALDLGIAGGEERLLRVKLGDALGNSGHGRDSAGAYLDAVRGAGPVESLELQRRAADQLLRSGHLDLGLAVLRDVLGRLGLKLHQSARRALLSLVVRRARIALRGLRFRECDESRVAPEKLLRIDACWSVATTLSLVDPIRAQDFQARHLLLALQAGERRRVARAIACESPFLAMAGVRSRRRTDAVLALAARLAEELDDPYLRGLVALTMGSTAHMQGRYPEAREKFARADVILRERCLGVVWERETNNTFWLTCLLYLGELRELCLRFPGLMKEAQDRGDLFTASQLRVRFGYLALLVADRADAAGQEIQDAMDASPAAGFGLLHYWALYARVEAALYSGEGGAAVAHVREDWRTVRRAGILRIELLRIRSIHLRARASLAAAAEGGPSPAARLREAATDARRLEREGAPTAQALARLIRAGIAATRGRDEEARAELVAAATALDVEGMALHAAAARLRRAQIEGANGGEHSSFMLAQGIKNPVRMADMLAPGRWAREH